MARRFGFVGTGNRLQFGRVVFRHGAKSELGALGGGLCLDGVDASQRHLSGGEQKRIVLLEGSGDALDINNRAFIGDSLELSLAGSEIVPGAVGDESLGGVK